MWEIELRVIFQPLFGLVLAMSVQSSAQSQTAKDLHQVELGNYFAKLEFESRDHSNPLSKQVATLKIFEDGEEDYRQQFDGIVTSGYLSIEFAELDNSNSSPELIVSKYSGGARCCTHISVIWKSEKAGWEFKETDITINGTFREIADLDNDGQMEIVTNDTHFSASVYGPYACSVNPVRIHGMQNGVMVNQSHHPAFRARGRRE